MKEELKKPARQLGATPDFEGPKKEKKPGKMSLPTIETSGSTQKHPAKRAQPLSMKFLD